jgi:hypothetical protein
MTSDNDSNSLLELTVLLKQRLAVVGMLGESLEESRWALGRKDAEAIARGAAHQAELCRQWSRLEEQLRTKSVPAETRRVRGTSDPTQRENSAELAAQWESLSARLRYLMRVHWSLLRHMQRSLGVLNRMIDRCAPTYSAPAAADRPQPNLTQPNLKQPNPTQPNLGAGD